MIYEDDDVKVIMAEKQAVLGELHVMPKQDLGSIEDASDELTQKLFSVASACASAVFESLGAQGTNIIVDNGKDIDGLKLRVIPRSQDDGLNFQWDAKQADQTDLDDIAKKISGHTPLSEKKEEIKHVDTRECEDLEDDADYLIKGITRIP